MRETTYDYGVIKHTNRQKDYRYKHFLKTKRVPSCRYRAIFEQHICRTLWPNMVIHHIDCDCGNNSPDNLVVCNSKNHKILHNQLEYLARDLMEIGLIKFDKTKFEYYIDKTFFEVLE